MRNTHKQKSYLYEYIYINLLALNFLFIKESLISIQFILFFYNFFFHKNQFEPNRNNLRKKKQNNNET
jgi:hypothetical protein